MNLLTDISDDKRAQLVESTLAAMRERIEESLARKVNQVFRSDIDLGKGDRLRFTYSMEVRAEEVIKLAEGGAHVMWLEPQEVRGVRAGKTCEHCQGSGVVNG